MTFHEAASRLRDRLFRRRRAYQAVFTANGELGPAAAIVMADLAKYCHARHTSFQFSSVTRQSDALAMAFAEGRRDVFNRIAGLCNLTSDQIDRIAQQRSDDD